MLVLSSCFSAGYHRPVVARAGGRHPLVIGRNPLVLAVSAADECLTAAPDASAADSCEVLDPEATLRRYLQLRTVLSGEPLPDAAVESLIRRVEEVSEPGFDEEQIWGEWQLCWQFNAAAATRSQKALAPLPQFSNFMTDERGAKVFRNIVQLTARRVRVVADVAYTPPPQDSERPGRLASSISGASIQLALGRRWGWKPLRLPLPLRGEGWLEVRLGIRSSASAASAFASASASSSAASASSSAASASASALTLPCLTPHQVTHLSDQMRITRGNRGGAYRRFPKPRAGLASVAPPLALIAPAANPHPRPHLHPHLSRLPSPLALALTAGVFVHLRPQMLTREAARDQAGVEAVEAVEATKVAAEPVVAAPAAASSVTSWYDRGIRLTPPQPRQP